MGVGQVGLARRDEMPDGAEVGLQPGDRFAVAPDGERQLGFDGGLEGGVGELHGVAVDGRGLARDGQRGLGGCSG